MLNKKFTILILFILLTGCVDQRVGGVDDNIIKKDKVDEQYKIKAETKSDILYSYLTNVCVEKNGADCLKTEPAVEYVYKSKIEVPKQTRYLEDGKLVKEKTEKDLLGAGDVIEEDLSLRTYNTLQFPIDEKTTIAHSFAGASFYYDGGKWYEVEYENTTVDAYNIQMDTNFATSATGTSFWLNSIDKFHIDFLWQAREAIAVDIYSSVGDGNVLGYSASAWPAVVNVADGIGVDYTAVEVHYQAHQNYIRRLFFAYDTSSLADDVTVTAVNSIIYTGPTAGNGTDAQSEFYLVAGSQSSVSVLANADYNNFNKTNVYSSKITPATSNNVNTVALNATGIAAISLTGYTKIAFLHENDYSATDPVAGNYYKFMSMSEATGTSKDPYLAITFTGGASPVPAKSIPALFFN